jgi:nucleoid DNA-binding protein
MAVIHKTEFIKKLAEIGKFTKSDAQEFLDAMTEIFYNAAISGDTIAVKNFGRLYTQFLGERHITKGEKAGTIYPPATRVVFKLSEYIRYAGKENYQYKEEDEDTDVDDGE